MARPNPSMREEASRLRKNCLRAFDRDGFERGIVEMVMAGRYTLEHNPRFYGEILLGGIREEGTIWSAGRRAEDIRTEIGWDYHRSPPLAASRIAASVFATIAYGHAFNDGNKRTGFLASTSTALALGFIWRENDVPLTELLEDVRRFVEANESDDPSRIEGAGTDHVARWLLDKVFTLP